VSLAEHGLIPPLRMILKRATEPDPRRRYANAGELAAALRSVAQLLAIPDVPAYIARAVEDAFTPEILASHVAAHELEPPPPECVAEVVPGGYETYANIVEISKAPRILHERPRRRGLPPPPSGLTKTAPLAKPEPPPPAKPAPKAEKPKLTRTSTLVLPGAPAPPPNTAPPAPKSSARPAPKQAVAAPAAKGKPRIPRPTPRAPTQDSSPTIVCAKPLFDDD
jgi:hypothetical protein